MTFFVIAYLGLIWFYAFRLNSRNYVLSLDCSISIIQYLSQLERHLASGVLIRKLVVSLFAILLWIWKCNKHRGASRDSWTNSLFQLYFEPNIFSKALSWQVHLFGVFDFSSPYFRLWVYKLTLLCQNVENIIRASRVFARPDSCFATLLLHMKT